MVIRNDTRHSATVKYSGREAEGGEVVAEGTFTVPAGQNWQVDRIRTYASDQKLYLITWETGGERFGNHYLAGRPPFALERYRRWLAMIAALPRPFSAGAVGQ